MTNEEMEAAIKQMGRLLADIARELAPLLERLQGYQDHPGLMGGEIPVPTVANRVARLQADADALLIALGLDQSNQSEGSL